ncbi:glycosyltransferase family 2 protein [Tsuneonella mangrovi]|uniref:glycosyltransferase family 2 protein n=1 Tax=Tsuneonella mangrovi TaxID=1982042 RepID=UPI001F0A1040|nr:glycosyltransferase family A protein [Tsuneonella mangrovi]
MWVAVATVGRAEILRESIGWLDRQVRRPDGILVVGSCAEDVAGLDEACPDVQIALSDKGLCKQRNAALARIRDEADALVFFDDDFVADRNYLEQVEQIFADNPQVVGLTGELLADGARTGELDFSQALDILVEDADQASVAQAECTSLYGCNMVIRMSAARNLTFDETLPLYGWQEDVDFTTQLGRRGAMWCTARLTGIHLGVRSGRQSGVKLGYSQVANVVYLLRKGTIGRWHGISLMGRNFIANAVRSFLPEREIDRRGRLAGNLMAAADCLRGRVSPQRIESL